MSRVTCVPSHALEFVEAAAARRAAQARRIESRQPVDCPPDLLTQHLVTIAIGILNGTDAVDFNRDQILTHVHSGTLGWITLSIVAASAWYARGIDRRLAIALGSIIPIYVAAFYLGNPTLREVVGTILLIAILWLVVWAWQLARRQRTLPALAIALGLTTFTYGAIIGKTGTLPGTDGGVSTLAGIAYTRDRGPVIFAIFNTRGSVATYRKLQDEFMKGFIVESGGMPEVNASLHRLNN